MLKCLTDRGRTYGGLPFPGTGCPVQDVGFDYFIDLYLGLYSLRRRRLISIGIPIINLRRSSDRLRFIMGIPIPVRRCLLSE